MELSKEQLDYIAEQIVNQQKANEPAKEEEPETVNKEEETPTIKPTINYINDTKSEPTNQKVRIGTPFGTTFTPGVDMLNSKSVEWMVDNIGEVNKLIGGNS